MQKSDSRLKQSPCRDGCCFSRLELKSRVDCSRERDTLLCAKSCNTWCGELVLRELQRIHKDLVLQGGCFAGLCGGGGGAVLFCSKQGERKSSQELGTGAEGTGGGVPQEITSHEKWKCSKQL